jgi:signal transduction histidine kinase
MTAVEDFETLVAATLRVNSTEDLEAMCRSILSGACQVLRSEAASLMLVEAPSGTLKWFSVLGEAGEMLVNQDLAPGEGVAGWVAQTGQSVVTNEAAEDPRFCGRIDALSGFVTRSLLCVPLVANGRILGVLEFINHPEGHPYGDYDVRKAQAFASLSAVALEHARLIRVAEEVGNAREIARFKNEMASVVAQEIRNPLTSIRGFAEIVVDEETDPVRARESALRVLGEARRTERLLDDFLALSSVESAALGEERVALEPVVARCARRHQEGSALHEVRVVADGGTAFGLADAVRVEEVVDRLLSNAIRYSPEGGTVTVRLSRRGGDWRISVTDHGLGIPPECQARLFHPFYRIPGHGALPGSGLGLTMVKTLVERMNGRVAVESDPERGTTFWFTVPAAEG